MSSGTLLYEFLYTGTEDPAPDFSVLYVPINNTGGSFTTLNVSYTNVANFISVTVHYQYTNHNNNDGFTFQYVASFYSDNTSGLTVTQFASIPLSRGGLQFANLPDLTFTATDRPLILSNTSLASCFFDCINFNSPINTWNTTNVISLNQTFKNATLFNQPLNSWNVSNVRSLYYTFWVARAFNQPLNNWNTSKVTTMAGTFAQTDNFNQNINNWNTSRVTDMTEMFFFAIAFNQPLNSWNVSNVTSMQSMFYNASLFNQPLSLWNTSQVTDMSFMFGLASAFNDASLINWNTSSVTTMANMFEGAISFNQSLDSWNTLSLLNISGMFQGAVSFNQSLNHLNVSNVVNMYYAFYNAVSFNQPLNLWETNNVVNMSAMFRNTINFNQDLSGWNVASVTEYTDFSIGSGLSPQNLPHFNNTPIVCFKSGSKILCLIDDVETYIPIEQIRKGMIVKTNISGNKKVELIGKSTMFNPEHKEFSRNRLYKCTSSNYPELIEDLIITGCHCILVDNLSQEERDDILELIKDIYITENKYRLPSCLDKRAIMYEESGHFTIYHLALESKEYYKNYGIFANGLLVESCSLRCLNDLSHMELIE